MLLTCPGCNKRNRVAAKHLAGAVRCGACRTALTPLDAPVDADAETFDEVTREAPVPVLVDFWADWCAPCRRAAPEVKRTAHEMAGRAVVLKVDTEAHPELAARFHVSGIPYFLVTYGGRPVFGQAGLVAAETMKSWLESAADAP